MTKTLTEQWREGTLAEGCYYILNKNGNVKTERTCFYSHTDEQCFCFTVNRDIEEVLSSVPTYDEYQKLQEQLNEANELLKAYGTESLWESLSLSCDEATEYCKKWGVK